MSSPSGSGSMSSQANTQQTGNGTGTGTGTGTGPVAVKKSDKELDLQNANRGVWLVKVPKYLSDRWEKAKEGTDVGRLKITRRQGAKPQVSFTCDDSIVGERMSPESSSSSSFSSTNRQIPKEHKFVVGAVHAQTLAILSHTSSDPDAVVPGPDRLALEGKVVQRAECRPISNNVYMSLKKEALLKAIEPARQTKQTDHVVNYKPVANHRTNILWEKKKKEEGKKSRDDKHAVAEKLFALFEKHQYYNIRDLVKETRQPISYLKEILKEYCNYNLKNPHKNMWELKPEYRHYKKDEEEKMEEEKDSSSDGD